MPVVLFISAAVSLVSDHDASGSSHSTARCQQYDVRATLSADWTEFTSQQ